MHFIKRLFRVGTSRRGPATKNRVGPQDAQADPLMGLGTFRYRLRFTAKGHERIIHASDEREAATKAEAILRQFHERQLPIRYRIEFPVGAGARRLAQYLDDVERELETRV